MALRPKPASPDDFIKAANQQNESELQQQIEQLEQKLTEQAEYSQRLITEIEQLRVKSQSGQENQQLQSQIDELLEHLKQQQSIVNYPIEKIYPNPYQPRKSFTEEVKAMVESLREEGQLDPVIVFLEDGRLFDGECRWRAATILGWQTLNVVFIAHLKDEKALRRKAYLTSRHRRDLNFLDRAEALVSIACDEIPGLAAEDVPRIVNRVLVRLQRKKQTFGKRLHLETQRIQQETLAHLMLDPIESALFSVFLRLQEHPASLYRNIFPALKLLPDLKTAVREQGLNCPQALIINRLTAEELNISVSKAQKLRAKAVEEVLARAFSESETQQWVNQLKAQYINPESSSRNPQVERFLKSLKGFDLMQMECSIEQRLEMRRFLTILLQQLDESEK